jgi:TolB protein
MQTDMLERQIPRLLEELADEHTPDYYDDLFWQTARTSQRSAWTIRERWLPMLEIARRPVVVQTPWRPFLLLALLVAAVAAGLVLAGARQKLPPLTGPAGNGLVVMSRDGDIYTYDPRTGASRAIVTGPESDLDPIWSPDGTRILFVREAPDGSGATLLIARADGGGVRQLTPDPLTDLSSYDISTDGRSVVLVASDRGIPSLWVASTDGGELHHLLPGKTVWGAKFRPTGTDILFIGADGTDGSYSAVDLVDADGTNLRTIVEPNLYAPMAGDPDWSPDGTRIAYSRWLPSQKQIRVSVIAASGTGDTVVGHQDGAWLEMSPTWSPDGRSLLVERKTGTEDVWTNPSMPVIVSVDGSAPDVAIRFETANGMTHEWAPDGTAIQATPQDKDGSGLQQQLWDARTGETKDAPWTATSYPAWQRVAP